MVAEVITTECDYAKIEESAKNNRMFAASSRSTVTYYPEWFPINNHLRIYQRHPKPCAWTCIKSMCEHNCECSCVWTHLICLLITIQGFLLFRKKPDDDFLRPNEEKFLFNCSFICGSLTFVFSCLFHVFYCHSQRYYEATLKLDLLGIALGTQGAWYPWIYYTFYCERITWFILMLLVVSCGVTCSWLLTRPRLLRECMTKERAVISAAIFVLVIPIYSLIFYRDGIAGAAIDGHQLWGFLAIGIGGLGVLLYCTKSPESWYSGRYDCMITSHAIFHVGAAVCYWLGIYMGMLLQEQRYQMGSCDCVRDYTVC